jgi:hypothetical protein
VSVYSTEQPQVAAKACFETSLIRSHRRSGTLRTLPQVCKRQREPTENRAKRIVRCDRSSAECWNRPSAYFNDCWRLWLSRARKSSALRRAPCRRRRKRSNARAIIGAVARHAERLTLTRETSDRVLTRQRVTLRPVPTPLGSSVSWSEPDGSHVASPASRRSVFPSSREIHPDI